MARGQANGSWAPARSCGLQSPYARDQIAAMILYPILTGAFYVLVGFYLPMTELIPTLTIHLALVAVVVCCWVYVETVDPSEPGGVPCLCMKYTQSNSRYCANCRKTVPGLDHHCLWLNTCIGTRNYFFFFLLAVCGTLQFGFQTLISILMLTLIPHVRRTIPDTKAEIFFQVFMIIHAVAAGAATLGFGSLCCFHSYLQALGMGTYDWVLSKRDYGTTAPAAAPAPARRPVPPTTTTTTAQPPPAPQAKTIEMGPVSGATAAAAGTVETYKPPSLSSAAPVSDTALSNAENGQAASGLLSSSFPFPRAMSTQSIHEEDEGVWRLSMRKASNPPSPEHTPVYEEEHEAVTLEKEEVVVVAGGEEEEEPAMPEEAAAVVVGSGENGTSP